MTLKRSDLIKVFKALDLNVSETARAYGVSRPTMYKWLKHAGVQSIIKWEV